MLQHHNLFHSRAGLTLHDYTLNKLAGRVWYWRCWHTAALPVTGSVDIQPRLKVTANHMQTATTRQPKQTYEHQSQGQHHKKHAPTSVGQTTVVR